MYLFNGICLTGNLVNHLHRQIRDCKQLITNDLVDLSKIQPVLLSANYQQLTDGRQKRK